MLVLDLIRFAVPLGSRPSSVAPVVTKEKFSMALDGKDDAGDGGDSALIDGAECSTVDHPGPVPSICQLTELERLPLTLATPAPPPVERAQRIL